MKTFIKALALLACLAILFSLCACQTDTVQKNGIDGKDGVNGADGADGKNGIDGKDGIDGENGKDGQNGKDGINGKSAYDLAVENGFVGTVEEWLDSLKGSNGNDGQSPYVGSNGNWWVGNTDLGISAITNDFAGVTSVTSFGLYPDSGSDVSDLIQVIIDTNPNTTLYFPDGEYLVKKPIKTSARYDESVSLWLANYAEIKATSDWTGGAEDAIIMLGARNYHNDAKKPGSNYFLDGGIINGNGIANGVTIDSGRETRISNVSIKNTEIGLYIKYGANSGSSDADINNVNIICNNSPTSVGLLIDAYDNTVSYMRIGNAKIGVHMKRGGNFLRYIHPLGGDLSKNYVGSIGFYNEGGDNWYDVCYADQFETGFKVNESPCIFSNCFVYWWYNNKSDGTWKSYQIQKEIGFEFTGKFNATIENTRVNFQNNTKNGGNVENVYMKVAKTGGSGIVYNPRIHNYNDDKTYQTYEVPLK